MRYLRSLTAVLVLLVVLSGSALSVGVHSIQITLGAGATQFSTRDLYVKQFVAQNNAANDMRVGGSEVTASLGIALLTASHGSVSVLPMNAYPQALNLKDWYVIGTQNQLLDVTYIQ